MEMNKRFGEDDWVTKPGVEGVLQRTIIGQDICKSSNVRLIRIVPKFKSVPHQHPQLQVYYFLNGKGILTIENVQVNFIPGTRIIVKPNQLHSIENIGDEEVICIIFDEFDSCFESFSPYVDF